MRYIGSKSLLLNNIEFVINENKNGDERIFCDLFSGTSTVARHFKRDYKIISNDMLYMSYVLQKATIENNILPRFDALKEYGIDNVFDYLNNESIDILHPNESDLFIFNNYSPNGNCDRMYFTCENAKRIDFVRLTIEKWFGEKLISEKEYFYLIACLLEAVPYVSNITGTYGAYLKKWDKRALNKLNITPLDVTNNNRDNKCFNEDANELIKNISGDILYIDPPYNSRQYLPNYHILETIAKYDYPEIYGKTGLRPYDEQKSKYCMKRHVLNVFDNLIANANFKHIIISYSTDGILSIDELENLLKKYSMNDSYQLYDIQYRKYKSVHKQESSDLSELLFYIQKKCEVKIVSEVETEPKTKKSKTKTNNLEKFTKSPLNYTGGKFKLLNQIIPLFPDNINTFVDLFGGGFNVGINVNARKIIYNDIINYIPELLEEFQSKDIEYTLNYIESVISKYNLSKENEEGFKQLRKYYNESGKYALDLYVLICYSFNYQIRFNNKGEYNNPFGKSKSSFSDTLKNKLIEFINLLKSKDIEFINNDFIHFNLNDLNTNDFVYCDPPYLITTGSYNDGKRGFKGWSEKEEVELLHLLDDLNSKNIKFALSNVLEHKGKVNTILLEWSKKYNVYDLNMSYSNSNYQTKNKDKATREVLITNYEAIPISKPEQIQFDII